MCADQKGYGMWECNYGKEPLDIRLLVLRFLRKSPLILLAALLGVLCVGGPYFLRKVTFGPAKEYEAVTDFYIDYAVQESGEEYTYFNQTTWTQLITDDVFTDKILTHMSGVKISGEEDDPQKGTSQDAEEDFQRASLQDIEEDDPQAADPRDAEEWSASLPDVEKAAGITKRELQGYLYATMLSDTRIVTTTVTTNDPELTMKIERALLWAMEDFGREQKEIAGVRILQEPAEASPVIADVRTFRACMLGAVIFIFVTVFYLLIYFVLDEGIHIPAVFERRYGVPMLGTIHSGELPVLAEKLLSDGENLCEPVLVTVDEKVRPEQVRDALAELGIKVSEDKNLNQMLCKLIGGGTLKAGGCVKPGEESGNQIEVSAKGWGKNEKRTEILTNEHFEALKSKKLLLVVKAGAHNGKRIEKLLDFCRKCGLDIAAALLWEADERLIRAYEMPEHMLLAWGRLRNKGKQI